MRFTLGHLLCLASCAAGLGRESDWNARQAAIQDATGAFLEYPNMWRLSLQSLSFSYLTRSPQPFSQPTVPPGVFTRDQIREVLSRAQSDRPNEGDVLAKVRSEHQGGHPQWFGFINDPHLLAELVDRAFEGAVGEEDILLRIQSPPVPPSVVAREPRPAVVHVTGLDPWLLVVFEDGSTRYGLYPPTLELAKDYLVDLPPKTFDFDALIEEAKASGVEVEPGTTKPKPTEATLLIRRFTPDRTFTVIRVNRQAGLELLTRAYETRATPFLKEKWAAN